MLPNPDPELIPSNARPARVLVCDDSKIERTALARYLRGQGCEVDECEDGETAIQYLKSHEVDVALLDLQMPGTSGFDVLGYVQEHRRGLPVILLSGMPVDEIQQEIHTLPSHELPPLFLKPVDLDQLLRVLELQLNGELPDWHDASDTTDVAN
jgi:CheY-like chemotaxis protein